MELFSVDVRIVLEAEDYFDAQRSALYGLAASTEPGWKTYYVLGALERQDEE